MNGRLIPSVTLASLLLPMAAWGVSATTNVTVNAGIAARASLVLGSATINFPDSDPSTVPSIPATENPVSVTARVRTGASSLATLQALASGDLASATDIIPVGNITWTATGSGFQGGTMSKTASQPVGTWTGSGIQNGIMSLFLANNWAYATGAYTVTVTYTLTAP